MRFRPEQHLRRQNDIRAVRENGTRSDWRLFTLWALPRQGGALGATRPTPSTIRVAVVASTAAIGNAVYRARAKRRLREVFRNQQHLVPPGFDLLVVSRTAINRCSFTELQEKFAAAMGRIKRPEASA